MSTLRYTATRCLRDIRPTAKSQWGSTLAIRPKKQSTVGIAAVSRAAISTTTPKLALETNGNDTLEDAPAFGALEAAASAEKGQDTASGRALAPFARAVPVSPSYFSRQPVFMDSFVEIQNLARKYARLPTLPKEQVQPMAWRTREQYRLATGEQVKGKDYAACLGLVKRLHQIHPDLMPEDVAQGISSFKRVVNHYMNKAKFMPVDKFGRSIGTGRRKSSVARAYVIEGTGEVFVNGKPLSDAFGRVHDRESAVWALKSTERLDKYNVWATVTGGGTTGQAEAMTLAVAKALCIHEPALKNPLRRGKLSPHVLSIACGSSEKPFRIVILTYLAYAITASSIFYSLLI
jgi:small subunit ribosomal protein S9